MKQVTAILLSIMLFAGTAFAGEKTKDGIKWMTWDEIQVAMKKQPKKVWVDVYTDWCGWCKVMDKKTFSNPDVIKYMNEHFYAIKLNAESREEIMFLGKKYDAATLAAQLLNGQMSYPTFVLMHENFQNPVILQGYQQVSQTEMVLKYLGEGFYKKQTFEAFSQTFIHTWKEEAEQPKQKRTQAEDN